MADLLLYACLNCHQTLPEQNPSPASCQVETSPRHVPEVATTDATDCISEPETLQSSAFARPLPRPQAKQSALQLASTSTTPDRFPAPNWSQNRRQQTSQTPILKFGSRGRVVSQLQTRLQQLGYSITRIDGIYGPETRSAVVAFQRKNSLTADGMVGPQTWATLREPSSSPAKQPSAAIAPVSPAVPARATPQPVPSSPEATSTPQSFRRTNYAPFAPEASPWIIGWAIIYGGGWVVIIRDAVRGKRAYKQTHVVPQAAGSQADALRSPQLSAQAVTPTSAPPVEAGSLPPVEVRIPKENREIDEKALQATVQETTPVTEKTTEQESIQEIGQISLEQANDTEDSIQSVVKDAIAADIKNSIAKSPFETSPSDAENDKQVLQILPADEGVVAPLPNLLIDDPFDHLLNHLSSGGVPPVVAGAYLPQEADQNTAIGANLPAVPEHLSETEHTDHSTINNTEENKTLADEIQTDETSPEDIQEVLVAKLPTGSATTTYFYSLLDNSQGAFILRGYELRIFAHYLRGNHPLQHTVTLRRTDLEGRAEDRSFVFRFEKQTYSGKPQPLTAA